MALALDSNSSGGTSSATITCGSGDVLLCAVSNNAATPASTVTDNSGHTNAWQSLGSATGAGASIALFWTITNAAISGATVTPTASSLLATQVSAWSGGNTTSPFDGAAVVGNATNTNSVTTTGPNEIIYQCGASGSGGGAGINNTQIEFANFTTTQYFLQVSAGAYSMLNQGSGSIGAISVALVPGGAVTVSPFPSGLPRLIMLKMDDQ